MNLVGYTATALSRNDIEDTPTNKNVVDFAIVELKDLNGDLVVIYDDATGLNPETQKTCDSDGQVTFFAESGDYIIEANGRAQRISLGVTAEALSEATADAVEEATTIATAEADRAEAAADAVLANQTTGVIVFTTYALLDAYTPADTDEQKASYKVTNDTDTSLNGYYHWISGTVYEKDAELVVNTIDRHNTSDAVSGAAVSEFFDNDINGLLNETVEDIIPFDWLGGGFNASGKHSSESLNGFPSQSEGIVTEITFMPDNTVDTVISVIVCDIIDGVVTELKETSVTGSTTVDGNICTFTPDQQIYIGANQYLAIRVVGLRFTGDVTGIQGYIKSGGVWNNFGNNNGAFYNFKVESFIGVKNKIVEFESDFNTQLAAFESDFNTKLGDYTTLEKYDSDISGLLNEAVENITPFDWLGGGFNASGTHSSEVLNGFPTESEGLVTEITFEPNDTSNTVISVIICDISDGVVTELKEIVVTGSTVVDDGINTFKPDQDIFIEANQYLAIRVVGLKFTGDTTGIQGYIKSSGTWYNFGNNNGIFYNYKVETYTGVKNKIANVESAFNAKITTFGDPETVLQSTKRTKLDLVSFYNFDFTEATTEWTVSNWVVSGGYATSTTTGDELRLNRRYSASKRVARSVVTLKSDTVLRIGTYLSGANYETSVVINANTSKLEIYKKDSNSIVLSDVDIPAIVADQEYVIELERQDTNTIARMINTKDASVFEVSFNYGMGSNYTNGAGNHNSYYAYKLESGSSVSVKSLDILGVYKPLIVFSGDSITDANGRCDKNYAETLLENLGGNGCISAQTGADFNTLKTILENEVAYIKPRFLSVMIGTNESSPVAADYQFIIDFCTTNDIELFLHNVVARDNNDSLAKNITIESLGVQGAKLDIATSLNYDITQGYDPAAYNDGIHPNQVGNDRMVARFNVDLPKLRTV